MFDLLLDPAAWISLMTLTAMEVVLGIDNIVFIAILVARVDPALRERVRSIGIAVALLMRLGLLFAISAVMGLVEPVIHVFGQGFSGRDLILLGGGLFLIGKSSHEMYAKLEGGAESGGTGRAASAGLVLAQIVMLDLVFSLDSVITAVGMADRVAVMVAAMVIAVGVMLVFARSIGDFVERHPSVKVLALSFLLLIGVMLMGEGLGQHISKGYIYFAMAFSLTVELLNMRFRKVQSPVHLHDEIK